MLSVDDIMKPPPPTATIYISGFGKETTQQSLLKHFGQIGVVRKHKETGEPQVYLYKDEAGVLKGDGKITYDDAYAAGSAVELFDGKEFEGNKLHVSLAQRKNADGSYSDQIWDKNAVWDERPAFDDFDPEGGGFRGRGRGRGGRGFGGGRGGRGGGGGYGDRGGYGGGGGGFGGRGGGGGGYGDRDRFGGGGGRGGGGYGDRDRDRGGGYGGRGGGGYGRY